MSRLKTMGVSAVAGVLALALMGCSVDPPARVHIDPVAEEEAVRRVNARWLERLQARDAEGVGALFVEEGWTLSGTEGLADGREAIVSWAVQGFEMNPNSVTDWGSKGVWVSASGDLAVERGWWVTDEDGEGGQEATNGEYLTVFTKVDGEWKILADAAMALEDEDDDEE